MFSGGAIAAFAAFGGIEGIGDCPTNCFVFGDDHLCDSLSVLDGEGLIAVIDE